MQSIELKPQRRQLMAQVVGLGLLTLVMMALPALSMPLSLCVPLLACPLTGRKQEPVAWTGAVMPAAASLIAGYHPLYAASLMLPGLTTLAITKWAPVKQKMGFQGVMWYTAAIAASMTAMIAAASQMLGGPLWHSLTALIVHEVEQSEQAGLVLYRFALAGLISVPEGYQASNVLMHVFEPVFIRQMLMSLRLTLENMLFELLPSGFVQVTLIVGLFTALRVQRFNGVVLVIETRTPNEKKAHVAVPPGFRLVMLPPRARWPVTLMAVAALFLLMTEGNVPQILGQMCYSTFETAFTLVGAAVLVYVFTSKHPDRKSFFGLLAAAMYVLAPFALFLIGLTDQTFHYRSNQSGQPE